MNENDLAQKIDHTLLKPNVTLEDIQRLCAEARQYRFKSVCVPPTWVKIASTLLKDSGVLTITVVGFPLGYHRTEVKAQEARLAIADGAAEIDMVANLSDIKNQSWTAVEKDIAGVVAVCGNTPVKVIIETSYLTTEEKVRAVHAIEKSGAAFVKTSTGFATGVPYTGATVEDILLLKKTAKPTTFIKASGGIRDLETALSMIEAGADRVGSSSSVSILNSIRKATP